MARKTLTQQLAEAKRRIEELEDVLKETNEEIDRIYAANDNRMEELHEHYQREARRVSDANRNHLEEVEKKHEIDMARIEGAATILRDVVSEAVRSKNSSNGTPHKASFGDLLVAAMSAHRPDLELDDF